MGEGDFLKTPIYFDINQYYCQDLKYFGNDTRWNQSMSEFIL